MRKVLTTLVVVCAFLSGAAFAETLTPIAQLASGDDVQLVSPVKVAGSTGSGNWIEPPPSLGGGDGGGGSGGIHLDAEVDWANAGGTSWSASASWNAGAGPAPVAGDVAYFTAAEVSNPALGTSAISIAGLYFSTTGSSGYSITRTSPGAFTLTGFATSIGAETGDSNAVAIGANNTSLTNTIAAPIALAPSSGTTSTFFQAAGGTLIIGSSSANGVISGTGILLNLTGGGTISLVSTNTYTGGTTINGPTVLNANGTSPFGTGTLELKSGTLKNSTTSTVRTMSNVVSITGDFTFDSGGSSAINEFTGLASTTGDRMITVNTATTRFTNVFTLGGNLTTAGTSRLNFQGGVNLGGADRTITAGATGVGGNQINGAVDSSAAGNKLVLGGSNFFIGTAIGGVTPGATNVVNFEVNATGTISFSGANTFLGSVTVKAGTANVTTDSGLGSSSAATAGLNLTPSSGTATVNFTSAAPTIASLSSSGAGTSNVVLGNSAGSGSPTALTVGGNDASTTFAGTLSDNTAIKAPAIGSLIKTGTGALTLSGANTYTGGTTINNGTLIATVDGSLGTGNVSLLAGTVTLTLQGATNNYIADTATLSYFGGNTINLNFTGNDTVSGLIVDGAAQSPGTYGAGATNPDGVFTGTGFIVVVPEPGTILMFGLGLGLLAGVNRFRHKRS